MVLPKQSVVTAVAATALLAVAACGGNEPSSAAVQSHSAHVATSPTKLLSRSPAAERALRNGGPALIGPPVVVSDLTPGASQGGPALAIRVRLRLGKKVARVPDPRGQDLGGPAYKARGHVRITGMRTSADGPFVALRGYEMDDPLGFTPDGKANGRGWCYGAATYLPELDKLPEARALGELPSGVPQTVRIAISSRGGGETTYAVPIYKDGDHRIAEISKATGCETP